MHFPGLEKSWNLEKMAKVMESHGIFFSCAMVFGEKILINLSINVQSKYRCYTYVARIVI